MTPKKKLMTPKKVDDPDPDPMTPTPKYLSSISLGADKKKVDDPEKKLMTPKKVDVVHI